LDLTISELIKKDNSFIINVNNKLEKHDIGFNIEIKNNWTKELLEDGSENCVYWGKGYFINTGETYANFLTALAIFYNVEEINNNAVKIPIKIAGLIKNPSLLLTDFIKTKIFFNSENESLYAEAFLNIDYKTKLIQFNEKAHEYRVNIIKALSGMNI
jgi:hypothetical protein